MREAMHMERNGLVRRFLRQLSITWLGCSLRGYSVIRDQEPIIRYLTQRRWLDRNSRVKSQAFMPRSDGRLSVFRTQGIGEARIWHLGGLIAAGSHEGCLAGAAVVPAGRITAL